MNEVITHPTPHPAVVVPLYCCAGMRRSGSTLQAQLVAAILGDIPIAPTGVRSFSRQWQEIEADGKPCVLKCHELIPEVVALHNDGRGHILCCYRDIRDVAASISRKYQIPAFSFVHGGAWKIISEFQAWATLPGVYISKYENAQQDLGAEVARIAKFLGVEMSQEQSESIARSYSVEVQRERIRAAAAGQSGVVGDGANRRDAATLLHLNHIQSGRHGAYREVFSWYQVAAIEWCCVDWMRSVGYEVDYPRWLQWCAHTGYTLRSLGHRLKGTFLGRGRRS